MRLAAAASSLAAFWSLMPSPPSQETHGGASPSFGDRLADLDLERPSCRYEDPIYKRTYN
jgi:hypothetical protein